MRTLLTLALISMFVGHLTAQHHNHDAITPHSEVDPQPLLAQALRVSEALAFIGNPLPQDRIARLKQVANEPVDRSTAQKVQEILDPFCLAMVEINAESRVKVIQGPVKPVLNQEGWISFLVKVHNEAHITAALNAESPNALPALHRSSSAPVTKPENVLTQGQVDSRFLEIYMYRERPMRSNLSGLGVEYAIIQLYTRASGRREGKLGFNVGQGSQDIGFRNEIDVLFDIRPAVKVIFDVKDERNEATMASFIIADNIDRFHDGEATASLPADYRLSLAMGQWKEAINAASDRTAPETLNLPPRLGAIYPLPSRRLASQDPFPDFFFQPQVYRTSGEYVYLPPGTYNVIYGKGPEYFTQSREIVVPAGKDSITVPFRVRRWIDMAELGWYSADHHIHAAGCSHYESPAEGVLAAHMWRQLLGEDLKLGSNLTWGPSWYYQKQFFTGKDHPLSTAQTLLRYDVEVSGFPSSHAGHIVLLRLKEDDYPNATKIEQWPTWTLPVLQWARSQGALTGYAHSGWGLTPVTPTKDLPNYVTPLMDGIGANEYVVTVAHNAVDFYSAGDTPAPAELNMWYHTLNCGFRVRISGETDFPCISDERVGRARIYAKLDKLSFDGYMQAIRDGNSYVSDGYSHLIDFTVNGVRLGEKNSELKVPANGTLNVSVKAAGLLSEQQEETGMQIAQRNAYQAPYWHIERARIGSSRKIPVELVVNGVAVARQEIDADGSWKTVNFSHQVTQSSWVAVRIYQSSHTNPVFALVNNKPILEKKSAQWCREAVDQCWKMKQGQIRPSELDAARQGYDHARKIYDAMIAAK